MPRSNPLFSDALLSTFGQELANNTFAPPRVRRERPRDERGRFVTRIAGADPTPTPWEVEVPMVEVEADFTIDSGAREWSIPRAFRVAPTEHRNPVSTLGSNGNGWALFIDANNTQHRVHQESHCSGECPLHNPTEHHMVEWPLVLGQGEDSAALVHRRCKHGVLHPDPDERIRLRNIVGANAHRQSGIHSCDGCCRPPRR